MSVPVLTAEEKQRALEKAQWMRSERARLRRELKQGNLTLPDVLGEDNSEVIQKMRVSYLLQSLPGVGKVTCDDVMQRVGIHANRRVRGLGVRQRGQLLQWFSARM